MKFNLFDYNQVIWDWNGTLLNDVELCAGTMNILLKQESHPSITLKKYKEIFRFPVVEYYRIAGHTFEKNSFEVLGKQFMDVYEENKLNCRLFPHAVEILEQLSHKNITQHLLSAYEQQNLIRIIEHFEIKKYFSHIIGLDNIYAAGKSVLGKKLLSLINENGKGSKVLLIGDTSHDFEVAQELGIDSVLVADGHENKERLLLNGVPVFDNLEALINSAKV